MNELEDRLREAFAHRAEHTVVQHGMQQSQRPSPAVIRLDTEAGGRPLSKGSGGTRRGMMAVAAAIVLVVVGVGIVASWNDPPTAPGEQQPAPTLPVLSVDVSDPTAVSLDELNGPGTLLDRTYLALDKERIPDGVTIEQAGGALIANADLYGDSGRVEDAFTYTYNVSLVLDDGSTFWIQIVDDTDNSLDLAYECAVESLVESTERRRIVARGKALCLYLGESMISMVPMDTSEYFDPDMAVGRDVFEQLQFIEVDEMPVFELPLGPGRDEPADVAFAGTLSGVRWAATVAPGALRTMFTYVDGKEQGGFENDRSSQPDDAAVTGVEGSIDAIPGLGTILYGFAPPSATNVIVVTRDGEFARLPLRRRELESYFAVPVPDSIAVTSLTFVAQDGSIVTDVDMPPLPKGLGGGYGGLFTTTRNKPPQVILAPASTTPAE